MPFQHVEPARREARGKGEGISAGVSEGRAPAERVVRITLTRDAQVRFFGREVHPESDRFNVMRGDGTDLGKVSIARIASADDQPPENYMLARAGVQGSVSFRLQGFPPLPDGKVKAAPCALISSDFEGRSLIVRLPWRCSSLPSSR